MGDRICVFAANFVSQPGFAGKWVRNAAVSLLVWVFASGLLAHAQTMSTFAGGGPPNGVSALTAPIGSPWGIVRDGAGNIYVSDNLTSRIFKIDTTGNVSLVAGNGAAAFSGDGGLATAASLNGPQGLAIDSNGVLYIADTQNQVIRAVNTSTTTSFDAGGITVGPLNIATVAGSGEQPCNPAGSTCGDGGLAIQAQLDVPGGVAIDLSGNILIADTSDNKIRKVTTATGLISTLVGNGTPGPPASGELSGPAGVNVDSLGNLFIADTNNNEIEEVAAGTTTITSIAATVSVLLAPNAVFVDTSGDIFIADSNDNLIRELPSGGTLTTVAGNGIPCTPPPSLPTCDGASATSSELNFPTGIVVDSSTGNFWFADENVDAVRMVSSGSLSRFAGIYFNRAFYGDGGPATSAELLHPSGMNFDSAGDLLVADAENNALRKITTGGTISTIVGAALACNTISCGDGGPITSASAMLDGPSDVALDAAGNIYIADTDDHAIRVINTTANPITFYTGTANQTAPILPGDIETIVGTISFQCLTAPSCGDNGAATLASLNSPGGVFLDKSGNIYIADTNDNVIRFVNTQAAGTPSIIIGGVSIAPGNIATIAGNYTACATSTDPCGDLASASLANLTTPASVFVDTAGNIYVVDSGDNKIRVVNPQAANPVTIAGVTISAGDIATIAGNGTGGFSGDGHIANAAELNNPGFVFISGTNIFITDQRNSVVRVVNSTSGNIQTAVGTGTGGFSGDGGSPLTAELARPIGVRSDSSGNLYVSDGGAGRIRKVADLLATPPTALLSALGIQFGNQALATTSAGQTVTVTNNGNINNLVVSSVAISGANAGDFKQTNNCSSVVPGAFCTITVTFTPTATGPRTATVSITDNATGSPQTVSLNGTAVVPFTLPSTGTLSPSSVSAGSSATGSVAITWGGGSAAAVALTCSVKPAPTDAPTCSLTPSSVTPKNGTATSTLTISTTAATSGALQPAILHRSAIFAATWLILPGMVLGVAGSKKRKTLLCILLVLALAGCIFLVACGGGSSSSSNNGNGSTANGTPSGQYAITVTATSGATTQTENFLLTVQ